MNKFADALKIMSGSPAAVASFLKILEAEIAMPNIPTPTMGGEVLWNTLCESHGWRLQQNMITHHARILNEKNVRIAWGTFNGMERALKRFIELSEG